MSPGRPPDVTVNRPAIGAKANNSALSRTLSLEVTADAVNKQKYKGHGATWHASQQQARRMPAQHMADSLALLHFAQSAFVTSKFATSTFAINDLTEHDQSSSG